MYIVVSLYMCICVYVYTCIQVYKYTCIHVYMYTYIHVYMFSPYSSQMLPQTRQNYPQGSRSSSAQFFSLMTVKPSPERTPARRLE